MKYVLIFLSACLMGSFSYAQDTAAMQIQKGMRVRSIGPAGMSGRVTTIAVDPINDNVMYIGAASGGVWKSENRGMTFEPIFDDMPIQAIGAIAINPSNPDEIWVGTGEGNPRNSHNGGAGIYRSLDGGKNWEFKGLKATRSIHRILIHPNSGNVVVGAVGNAWHPNKERGVFKTKDGGDTWEHVLQVNDTTGCADLVVDPNNPNKMWAAMWHHYRQPWNFVSGGKGSGLYVSFDGGETWKERTEAEGLPKGDLGRMGIALSASNPKVMYVLVESKKNALFKSSDGGFTFKKVSDKNIGNRPFYYAELYVDPSDENTLYNLYSLVSKSIDGGKTFSVIAPYSGIHPDHHAFWIDPQNPKHLLDGNDGGVYESYDGGAHWRFLSSLPLGQFYHINIDQNIPYNIYGGMQDNGSWVGPGFQWRTGGIRSNAWEEVLFGDGFDLAPSTGSTNILFGMYQGGNLYRINLETGDRTFIQPVDEKVDSLRFNWNAALCVDPHTPMGVYLGSQFVHYSPDGGETWERISPDLTTNDSSKQEQSKSGGLTIDATRAENYTALTAITASKSEKEVIWAGSDDGRLHVTKNGGMGWFDVYPVGAPEGAWIQQIQLTETDGEAYVVINDYRRGDEKPYLFYTVNYGESWKNLADGSDIAGFLWSVWPDKKNSELLFAGSDRGLYYSFNHGKSWKRWVKGVPATSISDIAYHEALDDLVIGTFGRSVYVVDNLSSFRDLANQDDLMNNSFTLLNPAQGFRVPYKSIKGEHFPGHDNFVGQNKSGGVTVRYWLPKFATPDTSKAAIGKKKGKPKKEKLAVYVLTIDGDTVRHYEQKPDTGLNHIHWDFRADGVFFPGRKPAKKDANIPAGRQVKSGTYRLIASYNELVDSVEVSFTEPMKDVSAEAHVAYESVYSAFEERVDTLKWLQDQLRNVKANLAMVNKFSSELDSLERDSIKSLSKGIGGAIKNIESQYFTAKDFDGYDHVTPFLTTRLGTIRNLIETHYGENSFQLAEREMAHLDKVIVDLIADFDEKVREPWLATQAYLEQTDFSVFKKIE